jgi:hypothetical protein
MDNDIFVGGSMLTMNGLSHRGLSYWNGTTWNSIGDVTRQGYGAVRKVITLGQDLFVLGNFDTVSTLYANKIAKWNGVQWYSYPILDSTSGGWGIFTAAVFNNELYVGGNFDGQGSPYLKDIAKFNGTSWVPVGNGFSGIMTSVSDMLVFQGELYVSGAFQVSFGDPANGIVKWNGTNWTQLGFGIEGGVTDMEVYNNELYVCGTIFSVEGNPASNVAKWDGTQWSNLNANFNSGVECLTILNDEVYFGGAFTQINGIPVNFICKYTIPVGISDHNSTIQIDIYPNPANEIITITGLNANSNKLQVMKLNDMTGRTILTQPLNTDNEKKEINISSLSSGSYILIIESDGVNVQNKKVVIIN